MRSRWVPLVIVWALGSSGIVRADTVTLFDVGFGDPPHRLGQTVATGLGSATPSRVNFDNPIVQDEIGNLALEFRRRATDSGLLEQIQFDLGAGASFYTLDFDINVVDLFAPGDDFAIFFDTPVIQRFDFTQAGPLRATQPSPDGRGFGGTFGFQPEGVFAHFSLRGGSRRRSDRHLPERQSDLRSSVLRLLSRHPDDPLQPLDGQC